MSEWKKVKLGEICEITAGGDKPPIFSSYKTKECTIPIYSNGIDNEGLYGFTNKAKNRGKAITITGRGANVGTVFYRKEPFMPIIRLLTLNPNSNLIDARYLYYLLKGKKFLSTGSAQPQITVPNIEQYEIEYNPDIPTQLRISTILSRYDSLIENYQKQIKLLEEAAQRLYKEWFIDLRFPGHENTKIVDGVPEGWEKKKVGDLLSKVPRSKQVSANLYKEVGLIPVIDQSRNYIAGYTDDVECKVDVSIPYIVFGDHTRVLKYIPFSFAKGADGTQLIMSNDLSKMPQSLFYNSLINIDLSNYSYARHYKYLKEEEILVPIGNISSLYDSITSKYYQSIQENRKQIRLLTEARDRLLPKLMNGEISAIGEMA